MRPFQATLINSPDATAVRAALPGHEVMLVTILREIVRRHERRPDYPFIDTKLSTLTGEEFPEAPDPARDFKGSTAIYSWIQGRGLEALVGHARWLPECTVISAGERDDLSVRLRRMIARVFRQMEELRARNHGWLSFLMTPDGRPFDRGDDGVRRFLEPRNTPGFSDLFYAKGLFAAAHYLDDPAKQAEARQYMRTVLESIAAGTFVSDAISFDPKNPKIQTPGMYSHGPRMIALGALALYGELSGEDEWFEWGAQFIRHILDHYINSGSHPQLQPYDYYEFADEDGRPFVQDGKVVSDSGHGNEFVGLAAKFLLLLDETAWKGRSLERRKALTPAREKLLVECRELLPRVLQRNFENGFNASAGGICKTFDLLSRRPINSDLPWWNLPETMRAAALVLALCREYPWSQQLWAMIAACSNALLGSFVNPKAHLMSYQTRNAAGQPVDVIPACADADPGYHTGLSIIDCLRSLRAQRL